MTQARRKIDLSLVFLLLILPVVHSGLYPASAFCEQTFTLEGRVINSGGKAVEEAEVFIYESSNTRRQAEYISAKTDKDGAYRIVLPAGKYWAVARLRKSGARYGPLMPGDKHSGDPAEIELSTKGHHMNFTVADIREAAGLGREKIGGDYVKIKGRIIDGSGMPVKSAYVIANKEKEFSFLPDYISSWVDENGYYTLYVPRGNYYLGYAFAFPPGKNYALVREVFFNEGMTDLDLVTAEAGKDKYKGD
ncbi:MAG: carboxypeptidase-like regulatory domain-containing protein [Thermodesulfovibrionales bacterium]|nr:carboxypeptidase-like regulatory domain-containing protein [Thermodesulfovibrionales bacterium]